MQSLFIKSIFEIGFFMQLSCATGLASYLKSNVLATPSVPKFLLVSRIGSLKFNPEGDAILFVSGDLWVEKNVQNLNLSKSQNPRVTISKLTQNSCFPSFCNHPV